MFCEFKYISKCAITSADYYILLCLFYAKLNYSTSSNTLVIANLELF